MPVPVSPGLPIGALPTASMGAYLRTISWFMTEAARAQDDALAAAHVEFALVWRTTSPPLRRCHRRPGSGAGFVFDRNGIAAGDVVNQDLYQQWAAVVALYLQVVAAGDRASPVGQRVGLLVAGVEQAVIGGHMMARSS